MASNEGTSISNAKLRKTLVTSETTEEKTENLIKGLNECANLNESFANNYNNSSLDIAVGEEEKHILNLLLEKGANVISENNYGKTALDVPKDLNTDDNGQIIQALDKKLQEKYKIIKFIRNVSKENDVVTNILSLFKKNKGTTSIKGELYEINLFSLILLRTLLSPNIDQFYLGTSVQEVETLKDICLRYRENNKESLIFLYPEHTINEKITVKDLWNSTGNLSLSKYFNSYLNIRHKFVSRANDGMIQGPYEDTKCHFIIYTTAEEELSDKKILNQNSILDKTVQDILSTSDNYHNIFQYKYDDEDLKLLMKNVVVDRMKKLGKKLHESMQGNKYKNMLWDKHISSYHVFLANTVIAVSDIVIDDFRIGSFRKEFLSSTNESLAVFRKAFFKEAVRYTNISDENLVTIVEKVLLLPSAENVSELLQNVPTSYDLRNNRLYIIHNKIKTILLSSLYEMVISHTTYSEAFQIAIKEKLGCFYFKLPLAFGNIDINVNEFDVENSLNNISLTIENIIVKSEDKNILLYNKDKLDPSLLSNLLVFDKDSSMFKFNTCAEALGQNANKIINKLKNKIEDLDAYRFQFNIDNILKISFDADEYDYCLAKDFLNNLWFYTRQAKGHKIETYANYNLSWYYFRNLNPRGTFFPQQLCDIFSNIQNEIRKWWFLDTIQVHYVTNYMQIFNETLNDLANDFIVSNPNKPYLNKTQEHNIAFNRQTIESLNLDTLTDLTVIETENTTLSATKLYQYFRETNYNYIFIDFNYICLLPLNDKFIKILEKIYRQRIIIIYEHLSIDNVNINDLLNPSLAKTIILVINENHLEKIMEKAPIKDYIKVRDEKNNFRDLTLFSQQKILQTKLLFQGMKVSFETLIDKESQHLISANILYRIGNNETIKIGEYLSTLNYEQIKYYYVQRYLYRSKKKTCEENIRLLFSSSKNVCNASSQVQEELIEIKTLEEIENTVVLIAAPGMGKSTLLTHLSIETKKNNPRIWIVRVNLLDHVTDFRKWQNDKLKIGQLDALRFLCKTVICKHLMTQSVKFDNKIINFDIEITNGILSLKNCNELDCLIQFELEIFIHCYNKGNTILIFDGFDEIWPYYKNVVLELLKCLYSKPISKSGNDFEIKQHMWITSRPYDNIKEILEAEFGVSYSLKPFTDVEQNLFIEKYLKINLNLKQLNYRQFQNIDNLFHYMTEFSKLHNDINEIMLIKPAIAPLHNFYCALFEYMQNEIRNAPISDDLAGFKAKWILYVYCFKASELLAKWNHVSKEAMYLIRTPLHVYVAVNYFVNKIKEPQMYFLTNQWDLDANTFAFYENYLKVNLKNIHFEDRNHMDLQNSDIRIIYEKELEKFVTKHKQLAFYSIFKNEASNTLDSREIHEIQQKFGKIENSEENSEPKENVLGVPKFVHFIFTEYLAVEYIIDLLETDLHEKQTKTWEFILSVVLPRCSFRILEILDRKVNFNLKLKNVIANLGFKSFIFDTLFNKFRYSLDTQNLIIKFMTRSSPYVIYVKSPLDIAVYCGMTNFAIMLLTAITDKVTEDNLDKFIDFIKQQYFFMLSIKYGYNEILKLVLECVRRVDNKKMHKVGMIVYRLETKLPDMVGTNEEIIDYLKATVNCKGKLKVRRTLRPTKLIKNILIHLRV